MIYKSVDKEKIKIVMICAHAQIMKYSLTNFSLHESDDLLKKCNVLHASLEKFNHPPICATDFDLSTREIFM